jgi:hypothetical protein
VYDVSLLHTVTYVTALVLTDRYTESYVVIEEVHTMPERGSQKTSMDVAAELSLYDLFKNPRGPKHSELWTIFTHSNPRAAGTVLAYTNAYTDDPKLREAMLGVAAKLAAFCLPDSSYSPSARLEQIHQLADHFCAEQEQ